MAQVFVIGRVTADLEPQTSAKLSSYIRFDLAENIGYGETARAQFYQVWAWDSLARRLMKRKVKKGSLIWISGTQVLEEYTKADGKTIDKRLKVRLSNWDYIPSGKGKPDAEGEQAGPDAAGHTTPRIPPARGIDGDRDELPG